MLRLIKNILTFFSSFLGRIEQNVSVFMNILIYLVCYIYIYIHTPFDFHKLIMFINIKLILPIQRFDQYKVVKFFFHHQDILLIKIKFFGTFT